MPTQTRQIHDTVTHALTNPQRKRRLKPLGWLVIAATCMACFPPPMEDGTEVATGDTSGDGDGDGDGSETGLPDMGDASCLIPPVVTCTTEGECWASTPLWTAEAAVATAEMISTAEEQGLWLPSDLDVGDECWTLVGTDRHACTVGVCGQRLFGRPASELPLEPNTECDFIGAWPSTGWAFDTCFGIVEGVAVELRAI